VARWGISPDVIYIQGNSNPGDIEERIIGLTWEDLQQLETVTAVACGPDKKSAILRALRTGLLDFLIIDDRTPLEVMNSDS